MGMVGPYARLDAVTDASDRFRVRVPWGADEVACAPDSLAVDRPGWCGRYGVRANLKSEVRSPGKSHGFWYGVRAVLMDSLVDRIHDYCPDTVPPTVPQ